MGNSPSHSISPEEDLPRGEPQQDDVYNPFDREASNINFPDFNTAVNIDGEEDPDSGPSIDALASMYPVEFPLRLPVSSTPDEEARINQSSQRTLDRWFVQQSLRKAMEGDSPTPSCDWTMEGLPFRDNLPPAGPPGAAPRGHGLSAPEHPSQQVQQAPMSQPQRIQELPVPDGAVPSKAAALASPPEPKPLPVPGAGMNTPSGSRGMDVNPDEALLIDSTGAEGDESGRLGPARTSSGGICMRRSGDTYEDALTTLIGSGRSYMDAANRLPEVQAQQKQELIAREDRLAGEDVGSMDCEMEDAYEAVPTSWQAMAAGQQDLAAGQQVMAAGRQDEAAADQHATAAGLQAMAGMPHNAADRQQAMEVSQPATAALQQVMAEGQHAAAAWQTQLSDPALRGSVSAQVQWNAGRGTPAAEHAPGAGLLPPEVDSSGVLRPPWVPPAACSCSLSASPSASSTSPVDLGRTSAGQQQQEDPRAPMSLPQHQPLLGHVTRASNGADGAFDGGIRDEVGGLTKGSFSGLEASQEQMPCHGQQLSSASFLADSRQLYPESACSAVEKQRQQQQGQRPQLSDSMQAGSSQFRHDTTPPVVQQQQEQVQVQLAGVLQQIHQILQHQHHQQHQQHQQQQQGGSGSNTRDVARAQGGNPKTGMQPQPLPLQDITNAVPAARGQGPGMVAEKRQQRMAGPLVSPTEDDHPAFPKGRDAGSLSSDDVATSEEELLGRFMRPDASFAADEDPCPGPFEHCEERRLPLRPPLGSHTVSTSTDVFDTLRPHTAQPAAWLHALPPGGGSSSINYSSTRVLPNGGSALLPNAAPGSVLMLPSSSLSLQLDASAMRELMQQCAQLAADSTIAAINAATAAVTASNARTAASSSAAPSSTGPPAGVRSIGMQTHSPPKDQSVQTDTDVIRQVWAAQQLVAAAPFSPHLLQGSLWGRGYLHASPHSPPMTPSMPESSNANSPGDERADDASRLPGGSGDQPVAAWGAELASKADDMGVRTSFLAPLSAYQLVGPDSPLHRQGAPPSTVGYSPGPVSYNPQAAAGGGLAAGVTASAISPGGGLRHSLASTSSLLHAPLHQQQQTQQQTLHLSGARQTMQSNAARSLQLDEFAPPRSSSQTDLLDGKRPRTSSTWTDARGQLQEAPGLRGAAQLPDSGASAQAAAGKSGAQGADAPWLGAGSESLRAFWFRPGFADRAAGGSVPTQRLDLPDLTGLQPGASWMSADDPIAGVSKRPRLSHDQDVRPASVTAPYLASAAGPSSRSLNLPTIVGGNASLMRYAPPSMVQRQLEDAVGSRQSAVGIARPNSDLGMMARERSSGMLGVQQLEHAVSGRGPAVGSFIRIPNHLLPPSQQHHHRSDSRSHDVHRQSYEHRPTQAGVGVMLHSPNGASVTASNVIS